VQRFSYGFIIVIALLLDRAVATAQDTAKLRRKAL
jgi:hypothetical protein